MEHALSTLKKYNEEERYRNYVTDALRYIVHNTAKQGSFIELTASYRDLVKQAKEDVEEKDDGVDNEEKAKEIIDHIKSKFKRI